MAIKEKVVEALRPKDTESKRSSDQEKKRKREALPAELEIDVNAPEPPSKKDQRKAKKQRRESVSEGLSKSDGDADKRVSNGANATTNGPTDESSPTVHGIWIGNLPYSATDDSLKAFFCTHPDIEEANITRIHLPRLRDRENDERRNPNRIKIQNRGFAYCDFSDAITQACAIGMSETLLQGRRVLIKDAQNFQGRPESHQSKAGATVPTDPGKAPSKKVFVGNLDFKCTQSLLAKHFSKCGRIDLIHMAQFEDSGNCKGYAWVTFDSVEAAGAAVRGWADVEDEVEEVETEKSRDDSAVPALPLKKKSRKWYVRKLNGRTLRVEFAEDDRMRYDKRFGKGSRKDNANEQPLGINSRQEDAADAKESAISASFGATDSNSMSKGHSNGRHRNQHSTPSGLVVGTGTKTRLD